MREVWVDRAVVATSGFGPYDGTSESKRAAQQPQDTDTLMGGEMPADAWSSADEYRPERIHVRASDDKGHSTKGRMLMPKHWAGWIESIVEHPDFPEYRSAADFVRDAIFHRLHYWASHPTRDTDPMLQNRLSLERMKNRLAEQQLHSAEVASFRSQLDDACSELTRARDYKGLRQILADLEEEARLNFDEPYLTDMLDRITYWRKHAG